MFSGSLALWQHTLEKQKGKRELRFYSLCESVLNYASACGYKKLSPRIGFNYLSPNGFCRSMQV